MSEPIKPGEVFGGIVIVVEYDDPRRFAVGVQDIGQRNRRRRRRLKKAGAR